MLSCLCVWLTACQCNAGIEPKKGDDDGKYVSVNARMQRTQVAPHTLKKKIVIYHKRLFDLGTCLHIFLCPQHAVLSREFVELMGHCNTIQAQYRDRNVERIKRQLKISELHTWCRLFGATSCWKDDLIKQCELVFVSWHPSDRWGAGFNAGKWPDRRFHAKREYSILINGEFMFNIILRTIRLFCMCLKSEQDLERND